MTRKFPRGFPTNHKNLKVKVTADNINANTKTILTNPKHMEDLQKKQKPRETNKSYASVAQSHPTSPTEEQSQHPVTLENMFLKQSEKIDLLLQQMSTLLQLITTLVSKLAK